MEFPRLVYKGPAVHLLVNDDAEYDAAIASGWFGSVPEALAPPVPQPAAKEEDPAKLVEDVDELADLRLEAESKGVKVDKRWKEDRLREEIARVS